MAFCTLNLPLVIVHVHVHVHVHAHAHVHVEQKLLISRIAKHFSNIPVNGFQVDYISGGGDVTEYYNVKLSKQKKLRSFI